MERNCCCNSDITLCPDGVYRWVYELKLLKNPTILFTIWKIFSGIILCIFLIETLSSTSNDDFWFEGFLGSAKAFTLILIGMLALALAGYLIYAAVMGGSCCVLFEMNDEGITHTQMPKQFKKAQIMVMISALTAGDLGTLGAAVLAGTKSSSHSKWQSVKNVLCAPHNNVIKVNAPLNKNQVYVSKENFAFVRDFILSHCPNAKIKG